VACIPPCPTVSIDDWRMMPRARAYGVAQQLGLDERTAELSPEERGAEGAAAPAAVGAEGAFDSAQHNATLPPCSAARAYPHLYGPKAAEKCLVASVVGDFHVTEVGTEHHTHDLMLDFRSMPFPVLEGQSIGILPPGWMCRAARPTRASTRSPARATASVPATITSRSRSSACTRTTRAARCGAWPATTCTTSRWAARCR
jgi:benzoyl-CoA 2,3-dioxygenase component A